MFGSYINEEGAHHFHKTLFQQGLAIVQNTMRETDLTEREQAAKNNDEKSYVIM